MRITRNTVLIFCLGAVVVYPLFMQHYYRWMQGHGAYPSHADTIAIPIFYEMVSWLVWAPLVGWVSWRAIRDFRPPFRLFAWNGKKWARSLAVTLVCLGLAGIVGTTIPEAIKWGNQFDLIYSVWWIAVWLVLRAAALQDREPLQPPESNTRPMAPTTLAVDL